MPRMYVTPRPAPRRAPTEVSCVSSQKLQIYYRAYIIKFCRRGSGAANKRIFPASFAKTKLLHGKLSEIFDLYSCMHYDRKFLVFECPIGSTCLNCVPQREPSWSWLRLFKWVHQWLWVIELVETWSIQLGSRLKKRRSLTNCLAPPITPWGVGLSDAQA